ncbi:MAG: hypothetical protein IKQ45_05895 [Clostridia bacterium]|nr:hypothetical protein [Clostridia bacterium]
MIESWHVREALRSRLGSALVDEPGFTDPLAELLRSWAPYRESISRLSARVEDTLFNMLYNRLGAGMSVRMNDGTFRRVRTSELKDAADDVMGVLFDQMKVYSVQYDALHAYCMESGSFSAMRTLVTRFQEFMPEQERQMFSRIIRDTRPRSDWETWLPDV